MTIDQYNQIMKLAEEGKTGIEIVKAVNEATPTPEPEATQEPEATPTPEATPEQLLTDRIKALDDRITKLTETFHAVNIMNSAQPTENKQTVNDILGEVFAGVTQAEGGKN